MPSLPLKIADHPDGSRILPVASRSAVNTQGFLQNGAVMGWIQPQPVARAHVVKAAPSHDKGRVSQECGALLKGQVVAIAVGDGDGLMCCAGVPWAGCSDWGRSVKKLCTICMNRQRWGWR